MLPTQALAGHPTAPERSLVDARLRREATASAGTSEDISEDPSDDNPSPPRRTTLKTVEHYRRHLAPSGHALPSWKYRSVRGQRRAGSELSTRSLRSCIKSLEEDLLAPDSKSKGAGRRRSKGSASPSVSANKKEMLNRSHLPLTSP